jgi:hypothetical protein
VSEWMRTPPKIPLPERTAKKTLVASIVALHGNGCNQASYCWLLTYSMLVTIWRWINSFGLLRVNKNDSFKFPVTTGCLSILTSLSCCRLNVAIDRLAYCIIFRSLSFDSGTQGLCRHSGPSWLSSLLYSGSLA